MNRKNLTVPITSYDESKKMYVSPKFCGDTSYYRVQLLTGADQALRTVCEMSQAERQYRIDNAGDASYLINEDLF